MATAPALTIRPTSPFPSYNHAGFHVALTPGARLGPYEVAAQIGVGGMGEVYQATDRNLKRQVAIKVLPEELAADPDRLARFQREAEVLAALNHPHIAQIYGLERSNALTALVMELVEGPTLADRIADGAIPVEEALPIARQIAEALESAHEHGIVHRDLKPANIKLRPDGTVKVLDFGLAKALASEGAAVMSHSVSMSPTLTTPAMTKLGIIMGTAAYMAPEQAKGRPVDKRTDVWAFGCVLYEMLAGVRAFEGDDIAEALASVIKTEPDWTKLPADTPRAVRRLLRQCLRKDPKQRIPETSIARFELAEVIAGAEPHEIPRAAARDAPSTWRTRTLALVAAVAPVVAVVATWAWLRPAPSPLTWVRIQRPDGTSMGSLGVGSSDLDISPDGRKVVYVVGDPSAPQIYLQALEQREPQMLPNINGFGPVFSPDGQWIAFFDNATSTIRKVLASGGSPVTIAPFTGISRGMSWESDESIVFATGAPTNASGLTRVPAAGGASEVLTKPDASKGEFGHWFPHQLPAGRGILFTVVSMSSPTPNTEALQIAVFDSHTREYRTIISGASSARYVPTGHIIYAAGGTLRAARFNLERLEVVGEGVPVVDQVATKGSGALNASVSSNGTLAYLHGVAVGSLRLLAWINRDGREEPLPAPLRGYAYPRLSPDGTRVALDIRDQENDTWIWDLNRRTLSRLTFDPGLNRGVAWSADGKRVAFSTQRDGTENLYWQSADGTGVPERLTEGTRSQMPLAFTRDDKFLLFQEPDAPPFDMYLLNLADRKIQPLLTSPKFNEMAGQVSPNGRWLAYQSDESGRGNEIYVRPFPNTDGGGRWQVSTAGGAWPLWSPTGKELFYLLPSRTIMAVPVDIAAPSFTWENPVAVAKTSFLQPYNGTSYTVSPDGQRFLGLRDAQNSSTPVQLVLVFNWLDELERLLP